MNPLSRVPVLRAPLVLLFLLALSACQPEPDPARAGFFGGLANTMSGTYERRIDQKNQELSEAERSKQALRLRADEAERRRASSEAAIQDRVRRLASLDDELRGLKARAASLKATREADRRALADADRKVAELKRRDAAGEPASDRELDDLQRQVSGLREAIGRLGRVE